MTGDYKLELDASCERAEILPCDLLVSESTFALPVYIWKPQRRVFEEMRRWSTRCLERGERPVFLCYSLGKAQRVLAGLRDLGPFHIHDAVAPFVRIYAEAGVCLGDTGAIESLSRPTIAPPGDQAWLANDGPYRSALVSGWAAAGARTGRGFARAGGPYRSRCVALVG